MIQIFTVVGITLAIALSLPAFAQSSLEVVQSVPLETTLEVRGIRQTQQVWLEMINAAQDTIDLEEFYVNSQSGEALEPVLSALKAAASRGVHVRLLVDLKFYKNYSHDPDLLGQVPNIQVKTIDFSSGVQHSKYFIVDQSNVYLGSANFDWLALSHIHEIGLHMTDASVGRSLESVFAKDWGDGNEVQSQKSLSVPSPLGIKVVASPPSRNPAGMSASLPAVLQLLNSTKSSIKIQMYQYSTRSSRGPGNWTDLDSAIRKAAQRGVNVQLMVDSVALKTGRSELKSLAGLKNVEVRSVLIPEWSGGHLDYARLIHSKYFTADGSSSWVGTENWSEGYFTGSRNVGVILESTEITGQLEQIFSQVWNSAYASRLTADGQPKR